MRLAALSLTAPSDRDLDEFSRAFAVLDDLVGEVEQHGSSAVLNPFSLESPALTIFGAPRLAAAPVAKSMSVSDVEVSLSTVIALKLVFTPFDRIV